MLSTHQEELELLAQLGFVVNPFNSQAKDITQVWQISKQLEEQRPNLNYPIDGLVVKLNDNSLQSQLGIIGKTPRGWCAIKFAPDEVATTIIGITWQVGRTGKIAPVAELEPIELQGTTVKRATLHNYTRVVELNLQEGDQVIIRKAGDIIPEVVQKV